MRQRTITGSKECMGSLRILRELCPTRPLHELPMGPRPNHDLLLVVGDCRTVTLLFAFCAGSRAFKLRQAATLGLLSELETLPEGFNRLIASSVQLEWCRGKIAD